LQLTARNYDYVYSTTAFRTDTSKMQWNSILLY